MFANQKMFLDVKNYSKIDQLEANIRQVGGIIEKFLSKDITCVVTNRARTENPLIASTQDQSLRPPTCSSKVLSRGQRLLLRSSSLKDISACDPVAFAQRWNIKIVTLDAIKHDIERHLPKCNSSSPVAKQSINSHHVLKRRKLPGTNGDTESNFKPFTTKFSDAYVKFEDEESNFRPCYSQYSVFPHVELESDLSNGIFKCAENVIRPVSVKNVSTMANVRKQREWSKRGYCECCDVMYDDLSQHLTSADHRRFVERVENFADLDELIHEICASDSSALSPAEDNQTCQVANKMRSDNCSNTSVSAEESTSCHNVRLGQNQSLEYRSKPEESNEIDNAVVRCEENHTVLGEQGDTHSSSALHVSVSDMDMHSVNSENHNAGDNFNQTSNKSLSPSVRVRCDDGGISATAVTQSANFYKPAEVLLEETSCGTLIGGNVSHFDDMPELISSDCIVSLLEVLSSEHGVDSTVHIEEAGSHTATVSQNNVTRMNSVECCMLCDRSDTVGAEALPTEMEPGESEVTVTACGSGECSFPVTSMPDDVSGRPVTAVLPERHSANSGNSTTPCEHVLNSAALPNSTHLPTRSLADVVPMLNTSLITDNTVHNSDTGINRMEVEGDLSVSPCCEEPSEYSCSAPASSFVVCPLMCTNAVTTESAVPVYARSQVNAACTFDDCANSPVNFSDLITDASDLNQQLLAMAYRMDAVEHDKQQSCSSVQASSHPCSVDSVDISTPKHDTTDDDDDLCIPMAFSPVLHFPKSSAALADCDDMPLDTPVHSYSDSSENAASSTADVGISRKLLASFCQESDNILLVGSADTNDSVQSSVLGSWLQKNIEMNLVTVKQEDACLVQQNEHVQNNSSPHKTFEVVVKSEVTSECTSCLSLDSYQELSLANTATTQEDVKLADDNLCINSLVLGSPMSKLPASLFQSDVDIDKCYALRPESCEVTEPVDETDVDNDSASTLIYSSHCVASSLLDHASDGGHSADENESEIAVDSREPSASGRNSELEVVSFVGCRMRCAAVTAESTSLHGLDDSRKLVSVDTSQLEAQSVDGNSCCVKSFDNASDAPPTSLQPEINNNSSVPEPESHGAVELVHAADKSDHKEPSVVSSANSTWKVISFVDCRMRLVRTETAFPAASTNMVSPDSDSCWYVKKSCSLGLKLVLSKTPNNVLTC